MGAPATQVPSTGRLQTPNTDTPPQKTHIHHKEVQKAAIPQLPKRNDLHSLCFPSKNGRKFICMIFKCITKITAIIIQEVVHSLSTSTPKHTTKSLRERPQPATAVPPQRACTSGRAPSCSQRTTPRCLGAPTSPRGGHLRSCAWTPAQ